MKKYTAIAFAATAALALSACGKSDSAKDAAQADNVEMPAEEAVQDVDAAATPIADAGASEAASTAASDAASAAPAAAASGAPKQ